MRSAARKLKILPKNFRLKFPILGAGLDCQTLLISRREERQIEETPITGEALSRGLRYLILLRQKNM